jgi:hypothetical protein
VPTRRKRRGGDLSDELRERGLVLAVSGLGDKDSGGGLFLFDGEVERIDWLSTTGLHAADGLFFRLLWGPDLLVYDERGVVRYLRLDELVDPHDLALDGGEIVVVSTGRNEILRYALSGELVERWTPGGDGDAWHLNSLLRADGKLFCSGFGKFAVDRAWAEPGARDGAGVVVEVGSGETVLSGLTAPHNPCKLDDAWLVCNSGTQDVLELDTEGTMQRRAGLGGWTRGLALVGESLVVGVSAHRQSKATSATAELAVLDRGSFAERQRITLPCREIYDLVLLPAAFCEGLRRGLRTNGRVEGELVQASMFESVGVEPVRLWATGDALPPEAMRSRVTVDVSRSLRAGARELLTCVVHNDGGAILTSSPPNPVSLSYRWFDRSGAVSEGERVPLPRPLPPGSPVPIDLPLAVPLDSGRYRLCVSLVQEHVAWFDEIDPRNGSSGAVEVVG